MKHIDGLMTELSILKVVEPVGTSAAEHDFRSYSGSQIGNDSDNSTVLSFDSIETLSHTTLSISDVSTWVETNESAAEETNGVQVRCILAQLLQKITVLSADLELIQWFVEQTVQSVMFGLLLTRSTHNMRWIATGFGLGCITVIICVSMLDSVLSALRTQKSPPAFMTIGIEI